MFMIAEEQGDDTYLFVGGPCQTWHRAKEILDDLQILYPRSIYEIWTRCPEGWEETASPATMGRKGGSVISEAKAVSSAANGKKGGRPKKS